MSAWHIRDFDASDLDQAVQVWSESTDASRPALFVVAEAIEALNRGEPAVVAVSNGRVVGTCVARVTGERAWVLRIAIDNEQRNRGVGSALLRALEERLLRMGVRRIAALLPEGGVGHEAFLPSGVRADPGCGVLATWPFRLRAADRSTRCAGTRRALATLRVRADI